MDLATYSPLEYSPQSWDRDARAHYPEPPILLLFTEHPLAFSHKFSRTLILFLCGAQHPPCPKPLQGFPSWHPYFHKEPKFSSIHKSGPLQEGAGGVCEGPCSKN